MATLTYMTHNDELVYCDAIWDWPIETYYGSKDSQYTVFCAVERNEHGKHVQSRLIAVKQPGQWKWWKYKED